MKLISLVTVVLCIFIINANSQSLSLFDIDVKNFPQVKAKFWAFDKDGKQITNLSHSDIELIENGQARTITNVSCPPHTTLKPISSVLTMDVSGSMKGERLRIIQEAATLWVNGLKLGISECAVTSFDDYNYLNQDFTTDLYKLLKAINNLDTKIGTDYNEGLLNSMAGALQISRLGKHKRIIVFLTDGLPEFEPQVSKIIDEANLQNCTIYSVVVGMKCPKSLKDISIQTGGKWYENINTHEETQNVYREILKNTQGGNPCEISWNSGTNCNAGITNVELLFKSLGLKTNTSYQSPSSIISKMEFNPKFISFKNPSLGVKVDKKITVTAKNSDINVSNIFLTNDNYSIIPSSFSLKKNESKELIISYIAKEKGYTYCKLDFETNMCQFAFYASGGVTGEPPSQKTLDITKPIAGDLFVVGSDTIITWQGIPEEDVVSLEYSIDNGINWNLITSSAIGLKYNWENIPKPSTTNCKIRAKQVDRGNTKGSSSTLQFTLQGHKDNIPHIAWSPDGSRVATASSDKKSVIWDANTGTAIHSLNAHGGQILHISWSPDGSKVATASWDKAGAIWDAISGIKLYSLIGHNDIVNHISWSPDGSMVATASEDGNSIIWDVKSGKRIHTLIGHTHTVNVISWSPDGSRVATASDDGVGIIWDVNSGKKIYTLIGHTLDVYDISWSPDGLSIATASADGTGIIWDAVTGKKLYTLKGHTKTVICINWSPDGSMIATSSYDNNGIIWDTNNGNIIYTLKGHFDVVNNIAWSPDGSMVATSSDDRTAIIWNANTGNKLHTLSGHDFAVNYIDWSPDGNRVATASWDWTAKIWMIENSTSYIQEDESDIFSIVEPIAKSTNIDMGKCLVGSMKDSLVVDFVQNIGSWKFRVDSIYFSGKDADAFKLVSGLPQYVLNVGENKATEFRFIPKFEGLHSAKIHIVTQAETLEYNITGIGEEKKIQIISDWLDFGKVEIGNENTLVDTIVIKNITNTPINISNVVQLGPDKEQFEIVNGGGTFTLSKDVPHKMTLKFKPKYGGRTSGQLGFEYNETGSPATVQLFGMGIGGNAFFANDSAFAGETKNIKLILGNIKPEGLSSIAPNFEAKIRFQRTILGPSSNLDWQIINDSIYVAVKGQIGNSLELASIPLIVGLGNVEETAIDIVEMKLLDIFGNPVEYDFDKESGIFKLLGICEEGGIRLINPDKLTQLMKISPNPSEGNVNIELNLVEKGTTSLKVFDVNGQFIDYKELSTTGNINIELNTQNYSNGLYFIHLQTPTVNKKEKLIIYK